MANEDEILAVLAHVDAELEKSAGFIQRNVDRVKGFSEGFKNVGAFQKAQQGHNSAHAALNGGPAPKGPSFFQRIGQRFEGGVERGRASGQLHDLQHNQQQMNQHAQTLEHHTGQAAQYHQGPDYQNMTTSDLMHYQRDPHGYAAAQAQAQANAPAQGNGWMLPAAGAAGVIGLGGAYLWNRNRQQQQQQQQQYGQYNPYYAKMGEEKTAFLFGLGHALPHVAVNAGAMAAHKNSNLGEVLSHRAFQLGLQGKELHPTRVKSLQLALGPEALVDFNAARAMGQKLKDLSPDGQRLAMRGMMKGYDLAGMPMTTPMLGNLRAAMGHHLGGTAPELQAQGAGAKMFGRVMTDLTQHTYDPSQKQNIVQRGLGHLRGAIPALGVGAVGLLDPITAGVHGGINVIRGVAGDSRGGKNYMKEQFEAGLHGKTTPEWQKKIVQYGVSPAFFEAEHMGHDIGRSAAGTPARMYAAHERLNRRQNMLNEPHMLAAGGPGAPGGQPGAALAGDSAPAGLAGRLGNYAAPAAGAAALAGLGYTAYRGSNAAQEQAARMQDHFTNSAHNMSNPTPPMTVTASYDEFCEEKVANVYTPVYPSMQNALSTSMAQQLASKFVAEPLDAAHKVLRKKLYDEPKQQASYDAAVEGDEMLQEAHRSNPKGLQETFSTLRTFAPSMAKNPQATKSFLRQATMSGMHGGGPDFATIRLLAETEKFIQNSKGRGTTQ